MIRLRDARDEITGALAAAGARSPALLFSYAVDEMQFDGDGRVANAAALVEKLRKELPEQFARTPAKPIDAAAGGQPETTIVTKEALAKMKPEEVAKLDWAIVRRALSEK
jgi:hypothetical protein